MGVKLVAPFAGLIGSVLSIVGVTGSSSNPKLSDNFPPFHKWVVNPTDSIEVSYKCGKERDSSQLDLGTFKVKIDKGNAVKLEKGKTTSAKIGYEFKVEKWDTLKGFGSKSKAYMNVNKNFYGGLMIVVRDDESDTGRGADVTLFCKIDSSAGGEELQIRKNSDKVFRDWIDIEQDSKSVSLEEWTGSLKVSLLDCSNGEDVTKTTTCNLKLTDATGHRWGAKVSAKANYDFSQQGPKNP